MSNPRRSSSRFLPKRRGALFTFALGLLSLSACDSVLDPGIERTAPATPASSASAARPEKPQPPKLTLHTPRYPAAVIYILYREYLHKNPGLTSLSPEDPKYQRYLERRLREIYPQRGYDGMVTDAVAEFRQQRVAWARYRKQQDAWLQYISESCDGTTDFDPVTGEPCPNYDDGGTTTTSDPTVDSSWDGQEEHLVPPDEMIPTLQMEIDTLQMSQPEVDRLYYQESLADGTFYEQRDELIVASTGQKATIDDLIRAAGDGWMPPGSTSGRNEPVVIQVDPGRIATVLVGLAVIGWKAYRVKQAADRSHEKSTEYFGSLAPSSTKRDAHRHIFLNMQMRRYVGSFAAKQIADNHESSGGNQPGDQVMDLHNNDIGREVKYKNFRGHWLWDRWDWHEWAAKVRDYINYAPNAEYIPEWQDQSSLTLEAAWAREAQVPDAKYIYFMP